MTLGKFQRQVYRKLIGRHGREKAKALMEELLVWELHPSRLCDRDFECWAKWEKQRQMQMDQ